MMSDPQKDLKRSIYCIEKILSEFYGFDLQTSAADHLIDKLGISQLEGSSQKPEFAAPAGVWFVEEGEEVFIGLYIESSLKSILSEENPETQLTNNNIDAFCTLVEEVSHFHLILNRLSHRVPVSKLELESVGEIDKFLVSSILLKRQSGNHHGLQLARILYDESHYLDHAENEINRYKEATRVAARFWYSKFRSVQSPQPIEDLRLNDLRATLKNVYRYPGEFRNIA